MPTTQSCINYGCLSLFLLVKWRRDGCIKLQVITSVTLPASCGLLWECVESFVPFPLPSAVDVRASWFGFVLGPIFGIYIRIIYNILVSECGGWCWGPIPACLRHRPNPSQRKLYLGSPLFRELSPHFLVSPIVSRVRRRLGSHFLSELPSVF